MIYFFGEAALAEHLEHIAYYEEQRRGLGARYLAAFEASTATGLLPGPSLKFRDD